ncbi:glycerophosphodiester phosphodiesterase family protein [Paenibacillus qinlingensis]|uniref:glycerophosphodiester phosphodiesterase family protein n=1 Tax=Paenibacillus qinlingensis TaxID=1837343 RepID=UPI00156719A7|nr:glycerophosphodiester phosphodiesterase family protein [Paenibacillus qinlingensis]NQX58423.1 glycerophosphodiester phosphodiesterase [Paenibacillus qinlingensis]
MKRLRKLVKSKFVWALLILIVFIYVNNTSLLAKERRGDPFLMAHRGLSQTFHTEDLKNDTCTAERIFEPEHPYLENTIPSMQAAFDAGADEVEFDIHITKDDQFAVFHDWTLDCRTNVKGQSKDYTMAELKKVDIGYGYTADNGKSYPFRGKGIGLMPSLQEVLTQFSDKMLLIHIKTNDPREGNLLVDILAKLSPERRSQLTIYGGNLPVSIVKENMPDMRVISVDSMKSCLLPYLAYGWTGIIPASCEHIQIHIPDKLAPLLWGWPNKFLNRMDQVDTRVIVVGGNGTEFSTGFDTPTDLERLPASYTGGIWTNRIDLIAPLYK